MDSPISAFDILSALPFAVAAGFAILVLLLEVFQRPSFDRAYLGPLTAFGFACTAGTAWLLRLLDGGPTFEWTNNLDGYGLLWTTVFCLGGAVAALAGPRHLARIGVDRGEYYALLLLATAGASVMATAGDLVVLFVAVEIVSVSAYGLAAYGRRSSLSAEAGMKYFLLGAFASCLLLYGIALVYGATGSTTLLEIGAHLAGNPLGDVADALGSQAQDALLASAAGYDAARDGWTLDFGRSGLSFPMAQLGLVLILIAFCVKVGAAPFHMWAPDVYAGAPTPAVAFLSTTVKVAGFAALARLLVTAFFGEELRIGTYGWVHVTGLVAAVSMLFGNAVALVQDSVKRMLAWSSVAHSGYLFVGITAIGWGATSVDAVSGLVFYAVAYTLATGGALTVLSMISRADGSPETFADLNGLAQRHPGLAAALSLFLLSSAGIPPLAGFMGKFAVFGAAMQAAAANEGSTQLVLLAVTGIVLSVAGAGYYLRAIVHMYMRPSRGDEPTVEVSSAGIAGVVLCAVLTLLFGLLPGGLMDFSDRAAAQMGGRADGGYLSNAELDAQE